jgi:hypothetical protein
MGSSAIIAVVDSTSKRFAARKIRLAHQGRALEGGEPETILGAHCVVEADGVDRSPITEIIGSTRFRRERHDA